MRTIFLPGFSVHNKDWAEEVKAEIGDKTGIEIHQWPHWQTGEAKIGWISGEVDKIIEKIGDEKVNILAKSIGTLVTVRMLNKNTEIVDKVLLCGVPLAAFQEGDEASFGILAKLPAEKVLVIQNENDNVGSFEKVKKMFEKINPKIRVIARIRDDHHYPYSSDFGQFLTS